jgi:hypothetical protein
MALRDRLQKGTLVAWQGNGMVCVNQTRPHCVNQMGKTQSTDLAERHGRGTAGERHGVCESAFMGHSMSPMKKKTIPSRNLFILGRLGSTTGGMKNCKFS